MNRTSSATVFSGELTLDLDTWRISGDAIFEEIIQKNAKKKEKGVKMEFKQKVKE
jgi:hypothetical protein